MDAWGPILAIAIISVSNTVVDKSAYQPGQKTKTDYHKNLRACMHGALAANQGTGHGMHEYS